MNRIFDDTFPNRKLLKAKDLLGELEKIKERIKRSMEFPDTLLSECSDPFLAEQLEYNFLHLYLQVCYAREEVSCKEGGQEELGFLPEMLPCRIRFSEEFRALLVDTPVLLGSFRNPANRLQENILKSLVLSAVRKHERDTGHDLAFAIRPPYAFCLYRRALRNQSSTLVPDIDNIESRKIINSLVNKLSLDDSYSSLICNVCSIEYVSLIEECGTSILIIEEAKRNDLERRFLKDGRSLMVLRKQAEK